MSEPIIHVIPDAYYGGAAPKKVAPEAYREGGVEKTKAVKKVSKKLLFIVITSVLFILVVGGAAWYFTRGSRPSTPTPAPPAAAPEPTPPPVPEPTPPPTEDPPATPPTEEPAPAPQIQPSEDSDSDGLSLAEETLYGSQPTIPDTDNDGFLDGHELFHLYNPAGNAPERLADAGFVKSFSNAAPYAYEVLLPISWQASPSAEGPVAILINDANSARIFDIGVVANTQGLSLEEWHRSQSPGAPSSNEFSVWSTNKSGLQGLLSSDSTAGYFAKGNFIYAIRFAGIEDNIRTYKRTFEMMLNSFKLTGQ